MDGVGTGTAGRIEQFGAPKDLYRNPANLFVARFLGEDKPMRFIEAVKPGFFKRLFGGK